MNKLLTLAAAAVLSFPLVAQEASATSEAQKPVASAKAESAVWPAFFAICDFPNSPDVVGLRLTIPYSTRQENVTGIDLGFWGRSSYFEGLQFNLLRNDVKDYCSGFQVGLYNTAGRNDMIGIQAGLLNESGAMRGLQAGLINISGEVEGFQIGLINRCESMYGFQIGLVNVIRSAELQWFPGINIGF